MNVINVSCNKCVTELSTGVWLCMIITLRFWQKEQNMFFSVRVAVNINEKPLRAVRLQTRGHDFILPFIRYDFNKKSFIRALYNSTYIVLPGMGSLKTVLRCIFSALVFVLSKTSWSWEKCLGLGVSLGQNFYFYFISAISEYSTRSSPAHSVFHGRFTTDDMQCRLVFNLHVIHVIARVAVYAWW